MQASVCLQHCARIEGAELEMRSHLVGGLACTGPCPCPVPALAPPPADYRELERVFLEAPMGALTPNAITTMVGDSRCAVVACSLRAGGRAAERMNAPQALSAPLVGWSRRAGRGAIQGRPQPPPRPVCRHPLLPRCTAHQHQVAHPRRRKASVPGRSMHGWLT